MCILYCLYSPMFRPCSEDSPACRSRLQNARDTTPDVSIGMGNLHVGHWHHYPPAIPPNNGKTTASKSFINVWFSMFQCQVWLPRGFNDIPWQILVSASDLDVFGPEFCLGKPMETLQHVQIPGKGQNLRGWSRALMLGGFNSSLSLSTGETTGLSLLPRKSLDNILQYTTLALTH